MPHACSDCRISACTSLPRAKPEVGGEAPRNDSNSTAVLIARIRRRRVNSKNGRPAG